MMDSPADLTWFKGDLPDVHDIPASCMVLVWLEHDISTEDWLKRSKGFNPSGTLSRVIMCFPHSDDLNPLRWCDSSYHPIGYQEKVAHWAWLKN